MAQAKKKNFFRRWTLASRFQNKSCDVGGQLQFSPPRTRCRPFSPGSPLAADLVINKAVDFQLAKKLPDVQEQIGNVCGMRAQIWLPFTFFFSVFTN